MSNIDRAAEVIARFVHPAFAKDAAQALDNEGFLMPDLPEPDKDSRIGEPEWGGIVQCYPDGSVHITDDLYGETDIYWLRRYANDFLAAADYAERNQK